MTLTYLESVSKWKRFRGKSEKECGKPEVVTENDPSMDEPTTTTVDGFSDTTKPKAEVVYNLKLRHMISYEILRSSWLY